MASYEHLVVSDTMRSISRIRCLGRDARSKISISRGSDDGITHGWNVLG